ncbi:lysosomal membrane ascorbate-dependent ferrireductase CYB561A3 isoform X3 [Loxodonta africana]
MAFVLTVLGLVAVFKFHNQKHINNLYSLHSWLGITTVFLFACQWFLGFAIFLLPWAALWLRNLLKPIHVFFGAFIFSLAIASVVSGINEKLFFSLLRNQDPEKLSDIPKGTQPAVAELGFDVGSLTAEPACLTTPVLHFSEAVGATKSKKNSSKPYSSLPSEAVFANSTGMLVVAFGLLVLYILLASSWKRPEPGVLTDRQPLLRDGE